MQPSVDDELAWPWLELGPIESIQRYLLGLAAEREALGTQGRYLRRQLAALSR